ncbi:AsnC family transcriptional regulator [Microtetraspora sp. NBRC 13810]|uniref:Lrp/AsnC family transcriptional regulator n=1 Tax=Microtetraspora sp. NBRC 13810 TaxID=3030990 RepID=UPI0024A47582|nr:Lrp/AsnC family transcriptional regulator [Microtetraspora sp. NBRC 13810]GLW07138.1 AsnC family transcriptional regulator [Microtetraspora sp. NBRC 13810]
MSSEAGEAGSGPGRTFAPLDETDRAIIAELRRDGRVSIRALAEQVHISRANAYTRLNRLLADDVISGFTARLNPQRAGLGTSAYVMVTIEQNAWRTVSRHLREIPYIEHFAMVGGDFDILVLVRAPDNSALRQVVLERVQEVPGVRATRTWLVFEEAPGRGVDWSA